VAPPTQPKKPHPFLSPLSLLSPLPGADGFATRFGITYVDYKDGQKRYPKDSFRYLSKLWGGSGGADLPAKYTPGGAGAGADKENVAPEAPKTP
jgi:hypothetical protein